MSAILTGTRPVTHVTVCVAVRQRLPHGSDMPVWPMKRAPMSCPHAQTHRERACAQAKHQAPGVMYSSLCGWMPRRGPKVGPFSHCRFCQQWERPEMPERREKMRGLLIAIGGSQRPLLFRVTCAPGVVQPDHFFHFPACGDVLTC